MTDFSRELKIAREIAVQAGRIILEVYGRAFSVVEKDAGAGPLTEADSRANEYIVKELRKAFPGDAVIAEESKDNSQNGNRCWFVDPLDGTKEFVSRNGEFAVHIGLAVSGEAAAGVVFRPVGGKLYSGTVTGGSILEQDGQTRPLHVSDRSDTKTLRMVVSRSHHSKKSEEIQNLLGITQLVESGSVGLKCGLIDENQADLYIHPSGKSSRWDSCAPEAIIRGAGGHLTDLFGRRYRYDGTELQNSFGLIGCNAAAFNAVLPVVAKVMDQDPNTPLLK